MSSTTSDDLFVDKSFDWNRYLELRCAEEVPEDFFYHICKSEQNGIELGSVVEVENEDQNGYWFASVCSSKGVLLNLHYFGDDNDKHDFWLEVKSPRIHSLNWGSENKKKLVPPHSERFSRLNPEVIKEKVQNCEHVVSSSVLQMSGAPIYNIFKPEMFVEVQDKEFPYRVWVSKIINNVGGRLLLKIQGESSAEINPFWLFYLNERIFPLGWADQKGLPWRVMNSEVNIDGIIDSSILLDVLKPKAPEQHSYKVGEMLEVINPYSLMIFYVATIIKIYDNRYFKVEVNNDSDIAKRITFVATKENPYLFSAGWANKHKFLLKPPSDCNAQDKFCWSKYVSMNNFKLANVDNTPRRKIDCIHIGMKLEAVDPINPDRIRVATVKGFADHWMFLSFDRTSWSQELLHVRSIYSDEIFPVGWCNKHKYSLSTPTISSADCNDYEHFYYASDDDIDLNELENSKLLINCHYLKGDLFYHYNKKNSTNFDDMLEESIQNILNDNCIASSNVLKTAKDDLDTVDSNIKIKIESPELDEEFHDALFLEEEVDKNDTIITKEKNDFIKENITKKKEVNVRKKKKIKPNIHKKTLDMKTSCTMSIYFNKSCYFGPHILKKKLAKLPNSIGPGPVSTILQQAINIFINLDYFPSTTLKKIKKLQNTLFNGPGGIEMLVCSKSRIKNSTYLLLPESKKMAQKFCSNLCNLFGMCEYFMTTEQTKCINGCSLNENKTKFKSKIETLPIKTVKRKSDYNSENPESLNEKIAKVAKKELNWSNKSLVKRYKYYMGCIVNYEAHIMRLKRSFTQLELAILSEIQSKKNHLRIMDEMNVFSNTNSELDIIEENEFIFIQDWKSSFQNCYSQDPRFKKRKIDIGHFEQIIVKSNPKYWSPEDVYNYLSQDPFCKDIKKALIAGQVDGVAFMLLNEEQLFYRLRCPITLTIRMLCHVAEVKYIFLTEYSSD